MHCFEKNSTLLYRSNDYVRYSAWVYFDKGMPHVYEEENQNCEEIWFEFYSMTRLYWKMLESECIDVIKCRAESVPLYNFIKMKRFAIKYLLVRTNCPGVFIEREKSGCLTEKSIESVMKIHPRILRSIMDRVELVKSGMSDEENANLERQCAKFFGASETVNNPHDWLITYSNLSAFWEKFGLNYYQIMKLPVELFDCLKKMMSFESQYRDAALKRSTNNIPRHPQKPNQNRGRRR